MSSYIPFEIQDQIIQRLPMKSLIRFVSVCKAWKSLIESSEFVAGYSYCQTQPTEHLMMKYEVGNRQEKTVEVKFVSFVDDDTFPEQKFAPTVPPLLQSFYVSQIIDSSCGLLFLDGFYQEPDGSSKYMVVLWNPYIRKSIAITLPTLPTDPEFFREGDIVRWPFRYVHGFGVCPDTNDPKLVQITYIDDEHKIESITSIPYQVIVFTLSSGEWRCLSSNQLPRKSIKFERRSSRVIGRFIYWIAYDRTVGPDGFTYVNTPTLIMSFDLSNEEFREVDLPDSLADLEEYESYLFIYRLKESLAVVEYSVHNLSDPCVVWMMQNDDSKSFTKLFTIEAPHASIRWPLGFSKSGKLIFEYWDDEDRNESCPLVVYEPCSGHIKPLGVHGNKIYFYGISYTESLLLLDHDDGRIIRCEDVKTVGTGNQVISF